MKSFTKMFVVFSAVCLIQTVAFCGWRAGEVKISPFAGYTFGGDFDTDIYGYGENIELDDDVTWGIRVGVGIGSGLALEWQLSYTPTAFFLSDDDFFGGTKEKISDVDMYIMQGSFIVDFSRRRVIPYFVMGLGATMFDMDRGSNKTRFTGSIGGGLRFEINRVMAFRAEIRGYAIRIEDDDCYYSEDGYYYECDNDDNYLKTLETTFGLSFSI